MSHLATPSNARQPRSRGVSAMNFKSATTGIASSAMKNELNRLVATERTPTQQQSVKQEMDSFFYLFTRYLDERAKSQELEWDKIRSPSADQIVSYADLVEPKDRAALSKLAVLKVNGGLGTSMGAS